MGGGDVKMIGAVMLWIPLPLFLPMLMVMAIAGGLLSGAMLIHMKLRRTKQPPEVPYGVAIAAAGLWALHQHYLNQFQSIGTTCGKAPLLLVGEGGEKSSWNRKR